MLCPECGTKTRIIHTSNHYIVERIHLCKKETCGISFHTQEKVTSLTDKTVKNQEINKNK